MLIRFFGVLLLFAGATAATVIHKRYAAHLPVRVTVLVLALSGAVMGSGAALVRDFALVATAVFAAVIVPSVALVHASYTARRRGQ